MRDNKQADLLSRLSRFSDLSDADVKKVAEAGTYITTPADWSLIWEKTPADKAYIILDGRVSVRRHGEEIAQLGPGDVIGEMAIVRHKLRSASVVSLTPLEVLHYTPEAVQRLMTEVPGLAEALQQTVADRLEADEARG